MNLLLPVMENQKVNMEIFQNTLTTRINADHLELFKTKTQYFGCQAEELFYFLTIFRRN